MPDPDVTPTLLPDAAARARVADDLDTNLLVEAGAGSGKTTALVGRMVALVASGLAQVEEIAAVTFTRKAAGELRERFQTRLEERIREEATEVGDALVLERLRSALDDVDRVFIGTIHAFCARLLRERPLEVGLDPAFEELPADERLGAMRRFWDAYLERTTRDADPRLDELAAAGLSPARLGGLFETLVANPDVTFPTPEAEPPSSAELDGVRAELEGIVAEAWELMPEHEPKGRWTSLQNKLRTLHFTLDVTGWKDPADFFEALGRIGKESGKPYGVTLNRWKNGDLAKALRDRINAFAFGETPANALLSRWYAHRYSLAIGFAGQAAREYAEHRKRQGRLDFQDLLVLTARLLRRRPDVRRQLGLRYGRILVDEFQDTDPLQAEIMLLLASEPEDGEPEAETRTDADRDLPADWRTVVPRSGALFVVGDPKQSIYRFRRADIQLYGLVKDRFRDFGAVLELTTNFRSRPSIGALVNEVFPGEGFFPEEATAAQAAFEPLNTLPSPDDGRPAGVFTYALAPEANRRDAAAEDDAARISTWIHDRVAAGEATPGDFLILTRKRKNLSRYARALEGWGLPVQVTGAGVGVEEELRELGVLIEALIDPNNPVKVVAVLVGLFFGLDYERLLQHRMEGGGFGVIRPSERGHPEVIEALNTLRDWWRASVVEPADIFIPRVVSELGLLPYAAAGELGSLRAGALVYALEAVRAAARGGDASLPGALAALTSALELGEAEAPLEPARPDVVRLMNLHQAKGLEAEVVILAEPSMGRARPLSSHTVRGPDGSAEGYLRVTEDRGGYGSGRVLAVPFGWKEKEEEESRFEAAEAVRLLYVAVTRAKRELVVALWPNGRNPSPWVALEPWLLETAEVLELEAREPADREALELTPGALADASEAAAAGLRRSARASFRHASVTEVAKGDAPRTTEDDEGTTPQDADFRGFSWGSAVHGALAAAAAGERGEALRASCRDLLTEYERPLDDHGEPVELGELVDLVSTVLDSELWARAHRADRVLAEVPFAAAMAWDARVETGHPPKMGKAGRTKRQLDLFAGPAPEEAPLPEPLAEDSPLRGVLEGIVDLAFHEPDGWVIADYKTDIGTDPDFPNRLASYRRQVDLYAEAWGRLTGEPVKERVLFFTSQDRVEAW
jgi:ATP-dependent helicase/nuclease subunit A